MLLKSITILSLAFLNFNTSNNDSTKIKISNPIEKMVFKPLDTIWIEADIRSNDQLHNIALQVMNLDDSVVIYSKNIHTHANAAHVKEYFINPLLEKKGLKLTIKTNDHDGKTTASEFSNFSTAARKKKSIK